MIEIIDEIVRKAKQVRAFNNRVFRAYPQRLDNMEPFAIVNPAGRSNVQTDNEGQELAVTLSYAITIFDVSPEAVDDRFRELTTIYNHAHITNAGYSPSYQVTNGMFTAQAVYTAIVDKRGFVYSR